MGGFVLRKLGGVSIEGQFSSQQLHSADQKTDSSLDQVGEMLYAL